MSNKDQKAYFAAREADECANILLQKANSWFKNLDSNGYLDTLRSSWAAYHGAYYSDVASGHQITFTGEQGEYTNLAVNHFRNIAQNILVMITASRLIMDARAINTDYKSLIQTKLANSLLDYYMREKKLERYLKDACETSIVLGAGFIKMEWNATGGEIYDHLDPEIDPETGEQLSEGFSVYEGDVQFTNLSPFDVVVDNTKENQDLDWIICRSYKNRFDLAAKYPELEDRILAIPTKDQYSPYRFNALGYQDTDEVPVYEFFHRQTEAMPDGRYLLFLDYNLTLMDAPMPYDQLPVYRISPGYILGTPYGYTPMFDLLPIQDAVNSLNSTILTNQMAYGVQSIIMPRGSDVIPSSLSGGLTLIEYNNQGPGSEPKPLQLTATPREVFDNLDRLVKQMEVLSGVNSVARGNPDSSLHSGTALALIQSMALQYMSGLQHSYVNLIEDVGTGLIKMLQRFASVPRIATIVGKSNRTEMKEFVGQDLDRVNRVIVDVGNALSRSVAGRVEMAEQMMQMGVIKTPEQYFNVMDTGRVDVMTEDTQSELMLIKSENEALVEGREILAVVTDQHSLHIKQHKSVLADPDLRTDAALVQRTLAHIQEHIDLLKTTDPQLLAMMGEQSLASPPMMGPDGQPMPPEQQGQAPAPQGEEGPGAPSDPMQPPPSPASDQAAALGINLPAPAQPPPVVVPPGMPAPQGLPQ